LGDNGATEQRRSGEALLPAFHAPLSTLCFLSLGTDRDQARVRAAQVRAVVSLMPFTAVINLFNAALLAFTLRGSVQDVDLAVWFLTIALFSAARALRAWKARSSAGTDQLPGVVPILIGAATFAALWAVPLLAWFDHADANERMFIMLVGTGMISGASMTLATMPLAALAYVGLLTGAMIHVDLKIGLPALAAMSAAFMLTLFTCSLAHARQFVSHMRTRMELEEKGELIGLLREFGASGSGWLWELDGDLKLSYMSREMALAHGRELKHVLGMHVHQILDPTGRVLGASEGMREVFRHLGEHTAFRDVAVPTKDGRWWSLSGKPMLDESGRCLGWRGVGSDITEVRTAGTNSVRTARHDPLTGLANRLLVREELEECLLSEAAGCALMLIDLDRFKLVNDTLGHAVGDHLLKEVGQRLNQAVRETARVGRLGGDEFAVIWPNSIDRAELAQLADTLICDISAPYMLGGIEVHIGATIGIATAPQDGGSQAELTCGADLALYRAKGLGRGRYQFFEPCMREIAQSNRELESDLRGALAGNQLTLAYQPIVCARTSERVGYEALLRWNHPTRGDIPPDRFVPIIEDAGLINEIGSWVVHQACAEAATWPGEEHVAINVSVAQLGGERLAAAVMRSLHDSGLDPARLELELTESVFLGDDEGTLGALSNLRALGVRLVIDDFGQGYSSFGYLSRARFAKIKIDQTFVRAAAAGERESLAIVHAIVALASGLGVETTAEGVETRKEAEMMRLLGCTQLQGFYFGRPGPPESHALPYRPRLRA
jgi:diguanylate cyclase (GGDEF)-like protein